MNVKSDDIEIINGNGNDESMEDFIKKHLLLIFEGKNRLIYYDVWATEYHEK
jgi:hypothetical protein